MSKITTLLFFSAALLVAGAPLSKVSAEPIGLVERYALATDREAMLRELVPGTVEYFFYHCLHYQVSGQLDKAEAMLTQWKGDQRVHHSGYLQGIEDRQRILTYSSSPDRTIEYLRQRLGIRLDHRAPATAGQRYYPSELDNAKLTADALVTGQEIENKQLTRDGLRHLAARLLAQPRPQRDVLEHLLQRVDGPWIIGLDELVIAELKQRRPAERSFGDRPAHRFLTLEGLQRVAEQIPDVAASEQLVAETLIRLRPSEDADMRQQPSVRADYLRRVDAYASTLPTAYDGLKAATLYQLLQSDLALGRPNRATLLRYLRLPRNSPIVPVPRPGEPRGRFSGNLVDLSTDYTQLALLPRIGDEQPLVRTYLEHILKDAPSTADFDGLLRPEFLKQVFAEAKLLAGIALADQWYAMLPSGRAQALRQRVELTLAPDNPLRHDVDKPTSLAVDVKNVETLVIRVYKINTEAYYRTRDKQIDTDIDLDALVPTVERQIKYSQNAVIRHREAIALDEVSGRGVWIVDLLGGGLRARALVRRGDIKHVILPSANGLRLIVLDENRSAVPGAKLVFAGRESVADERGVITLPPMDAQTDRTAVLSDEELAVPVRIQHPAESYDLNAAMFLDRQKIQSGQTAELVISPRLLMSGHPVDPRLVKNAAVTIMATDFDGIATTMRFDDLELSQSAELVVSFRVPPRVATLAATLSGSVDAIAKNEVTEVRASQSWQLAAIRRSSATYDAHLTRDNDQWVIEVLGVSGEPVAGATVSVSLNTKWRTNPVEVTLQSDEQGRIQLGQLVTIKSMRLTIGSVTRTHDLTLADAVWPSRLHASAGEEVRLPLPSFATEVGDRFRLLMQRAGRPESDQAAALSIVDGMLVAKGLDAGEYQLIDLQNDAVVTLVLTDGPVIERVAAGIVRQLELPAGKPAGIESLQRNGDGLKIKLSGAGPLTRVHVIAGRYHTDSDPLAALRLPQPSLLAQRVWNPTNGYLSDLRLGDEYQYVMRRRYATKYPGVMLPLPGLILNPWETETTENQQQSIATGDAPASSAAPAPADGAADRFGGMAGSPEQAVTPDYDFLADSGAVLTNLRPDDQGVITIAADVIHGLPIIQVIVSDPLSVVRRTIFDSLDDLPARDLRLAQAIDADRAYAFVRSIITPSKDQPLDLKSLGSAQVQVYSSVAELMNLYLTISGDARLKEFRELGVWHKLDAAAKRSLYGRLASHELHLFLHRHDPEFFAKAIRPYLVNKKEKQLVDHYLLDDDLSAWTRPWRYSELNAAEKAILAHRVPEVREAVLREFRDTLELVSDDAQLQRRLIDVALAGRAMEESTSGLYSGQMTAGSNFALVPELGIRIARGARPELEGARRQRAVLDAIEQESLHAARAEVAEPQSDLYFFDARKKLSEQPFFQQLDLTKQWAESHWDRVRVAQANAELIKIDPFWLAVATHDMKSPLVSEHLLRPSGNRHAALLALAFSGLPLQPADIKLPTDDSPFAPEHPVAVITKRLSQLQTSDAEESVLVGQRFEPVEQTATSRGRTKDATPAPEEFIISTAYRGQIILTNPTPTEQVVDVLWQIPAGAVPLAGGQATDSRTVTLKPFQVEKVDYQFYFPLPGEFVHYPVCVAADGAVAARGSERTFNVLAAPSKVDEASWQSIATAGTPEQITAFLAEANLREIDWNLVLHRMTDRSVYNAIGGVLRANRIVNASLWGYALHHRDTAGIRTLLANSHQLVAAVGPVLHSDLLVVDPIERRRFEQLEYAPLVVGRIHPLREDNEILNPTFLGQYRELMRVFAYQPAADNTQRLSLVYYLLLQNRIEEAIKTFADVDAEQVETRLQYDYLAGYLALHRGDHKTAEEIARQHANHPVPRWRAKFDSIADHLQQRRELDGGSRLVGNQGNDDDSGDEAIEQGAADLALIDRERRGASGAADEPSVEITIEGQTIQIRHRNAAAAVLNLYAVDPELLFSKTPFVRDDLASMAMVQATRTQRIDLAAQSVGRGKQGVTQIRLDENLQRQTLLVEVVVGPARSTALYFGGNLAAYVSEGFGQVQVSDTSDGAIVEGAYVKVYARHHDGTVRFYKDGYTDLRGRFDFVSLSTGDLATASRLAILVIDPERGATIREASAPSGSTR
jgi:hypothetical protein